MAPTFRIRSATEVKSELFSRLKKISRLTAETLPCGLINETTTLIGDKCKPVREKTINLTSTSGTQIEKSASEFLHEIRISNTGTKTTKANKNTIVKKKTQPQNKNKRKRPVQRRTKKTANVDDTLEDDILPDPSEGQEVVEETSLFDEDDGTTPKRKRTQGIGILEAENNSEEDDGIGFITIAYGAKRKAISPTSQQEQKKLDSKKSPVTKKTLPPIDKPDITDNPPQTPSTSKSQDTTVPSTAREGVTPKKPDSRSRLLGPSPQGDGTRLEENTTTSGRKTGNKRQLSLQVAVTSTDNGAVTAIGYSKGKNDLFRKDICKGLNILDSQLTKITEIQTEKKVLATIVGDFDTVANKLRHQPINIDVQPGLTLHVALKHYAYIIKGVDTSSDVKAIQSSVAENNNIHMLRARFMGKSGHKKRAAVYFETDSKLEEASLTYQSCALRGDWGKKVKADIHPFLTRTELEKLSKKSPDQQTRATKTSVPPPLTHSTVTSNTNKQNQQSKQHPDNERTMSGLSNHTQSLPSQWPAPLHYKHNPLPPLPEADKDPFIFHLLERLEQSHRANVHLQEHNQCLVHTLRQAETQSMWPRSDRNWNRNTW